MGPLQRAVRDRADCLGTTCSVLVSMRLRCAERGIRTIARVPAVQRALAGGRAGTRRRELLGGCDGGQYADDLGGPSGKVRVFAWRPGPLPATGGFLACPFEVSPLRPAGAV